MNDDVLIQEDIPVSISNFLPPIQPIASQPLGDCEKSNYHAVAKKGFSYNELVFIISHLISILTKRNSKNNKNTNQEPSKNQLKIFLHQKVCLQQKKYKITDN